MKVRDLKKLLEDVPDDANVVIPVIREPQHVFRGLTELTVVSKPNQAPVVEMHHSMVPLRVPRALGGIYSLVWHFSPLKEDGYFGSILRRTIRPTRRTRRIQNSTRV